MAERRMFAKTIIDSDSFLDMPLSTQALYFHLAMRADDDGFLNNANRIIRAIGANPNDMDMLLVKKFIIKFDDGICVIKHWRIHNYIQTDRYHETNYKDKKSILNVDDNKAYTFDDTGKKVIRNKIVNIECKQDVYIEDTKCIQGKISKNQSEFSENQASEGCIHDVYEMDTEARLGKSSLDKSSIGKESTIKNSTLPSSFPTPIHFEIFNQFGDVSYKTWFEDSVIEEKGQEIIIAVPNQLKKNIVQDKYADAISKLTGKVVSINLIKGED